MGPEVSDSTAGDGDVAVSLGGNAEGAPTSADGIEPVSTPASTSSSDAEGEPVSSGGVSFVLPAELGASVVNGRGSTDVASVVFAFDAAEQGSGSLVVRPVRRVDGVFLDGLDDEVRAQVVELEDEIVRPVNSRPAVEVNGSIVEFVNGAGVEATGADGVEYSFDGVTSDGLALVDLVYEVAGGSPAVEALTDLVASLYVDTATLAATETCSDEVAVLDGPPQAAEVVAAGAMFERTWRIRNDGTCTWSDRYDWVFTGGDIVTVLGVSGIDVARPGEELEITVRMTAPADPGVYNAQFQLLPAGELEPVDPAVYFIIEVDAGDS